MNKKKKESIILVGYRGVGKTHVAKYLSRYTGMEFISLDVELKKRIGCGLQPYIKANGWAAFRQIEHELLKEYLGTENIIIDCGGGVVDTPENLPILKQLGKVVWLYASAEILSKRLEDTKKQRLSLTNSENAFNMKEVEEVLARRNVLYKQVADLVIDATSLNVSEIAVQIIC